MIDVEILYKNTGFKFGFTDFTANAAFMYF